MFPKKIFQTWKQKTIEDKTLQSWQQSWIDLNKNYEYELWDDAENRRFIETNYPDFLSIYDGYNVNIKRVDAVRYFYLLKNGGIYADLDFICLRPFDSLLENIDSDVILGTMGEGEIVESKKELNFLHNIPNAIMIAKPNSDFFSFVTNMLYYTWKNPNLGPEATTGPIFLKVCLLSYTSKVWPDFANFLYNANILEEIQHKFSFASKILIAPPAVFYPLNWNNEKLMQKRSEIFKNVDSLKLQFPFSFAVTFWMHSW
jgi:mannosyltransferase OCH1-like enzyme